jgi:hypothetical protein
MFDSNTGGSVITDGVGVGRWVDQSGNSQNATQGTSANRPLYKLNQIGGRPALDFDGSNDSLEVADSAFVRSINGLSVFVVAKIGGLVNNKGLIAKWNSTGALGNEEWIFVAREFSSPNRQLFGVRNAANNGSFSSGQTTVQFADNVARVYAGIHDPNGTVSIRASGSINNSAASGAGRTTTVPMTIGRYASVTECFTGVIGEVLVYNVPLSSSAIAAVEKYLRNKWSLP